MCIVLCTVYKTLPLRSAPELEGCYYYSHFMFPEGKLRLGGDLIKVTQQVVEGGVKSRT